MQSFSSFVSSLALALLLSSAGPSEASPFLSHHRHHGRLRSTAASASTSTLPLGGSTFKVSQQPNHNFLPTAKGARAYAKAFHKYGVQMPPSLSQALQNAVAQMLADSNHVGTGQAMVSSGSFQGQGSSAAASKTSTSGEGEVSAVPEIFDTEYLAAVQVGTPPQTLMLDFDTGSSDFWVFSSETPLGQENGQKVYDIASSLTAAKTSGFSWSITYGDGSTSSGDVYTDTVAVGGVAVAGQAIESATKVSSSFTSDGLCSGLLGLAFDSINQISPTPQKTFFSNAMASLAQPIFTANLKKGEAGNYNFGYIDSSEYTGSISYIPVNSSRGFWEFAASGYSVGSAGAAVALAHQAIADTGTTLLLLDDAIVEAYYAAVDGAANSAQYGGYAFPCAAALPDLTLQLGGGYAAVVPGELIRYSPADSDSIATATTCFGGVQSGAGLPFAVYGDIFLKAQFTVFDAGNMQLGLAPKPV